MFFVGIFTHIIPLVVLSILSLSLFFNGYEDTNENKLSYLNYNLEHANLLASSDITEEQSNVSTDKIKIDSNASFFRCSNGPTYIKEKKHLKHSFYYVKNGGSRAPPSLT